MDDLATSAHTREDQELRRQESDIWRVRVTRCEEIGTAYSRPDFNIGWPHFLACSPPYAGQNTGAMHGTGTRTVLCSSTNCMYHRSRRRTNPQWRSQGLLEDNILYIPQYKWSATHMCVHAEHDPRSQRQQVACMQIHIIKVVPRFRFRRAGQGVASDITEINDTTDGWMARYGSLGCDMCMQCFDTAGPGEPTASHIPTSEGMRRAHCRLAMARWSSVLLWTSRDTGPI